MDRFQAGRAVLQAADVVDFLSNYDGRPFDVTISSPPYNLGKAYDGMSDSVAWGDYIDWVGLWARLLRECTSDGGRLCLNVPTSVNLGGKKALSAEILLAMLEAGWTFQEVITWDKGVTSNSTAYGSWMRASAPSIVPPTEHILVLSNGPWKRDGRHKTTTIGRAEFMEWRSSVWRFPGESARRVGHPAPFPEELARRCIRLFSFVEDLIFDPFAGSGTTCAVAEEQGRESVGVDQSREYLEDLALPRIKRALGIRLGEVVDLDSQRWASLTLDQAIAASPS